AAAVCAARRTRLMVGTRMVMRITRMVSVVISSTIVNPAAGAGRLCMAGPLDADTGLFALLLLALGTRAADVLDQADHRHEQRDHDEANDDAQHHHHHRL